MEQLNSLCRLKEKKQAEPAAQTLSRAFYNYPLQKFIFPEDDNRIKKSFRYFKGLLLYGIAYGDVYTTSSNTEGVSIWYPSEILNYPVLKTLKCGLAINMMKLGMKFLKKFSIIDETFDKLHKKYADFPHFYLCMIGVDPEHQGKGFSSKLIRPVLSKFDENKTPCYLETFLEKNTKIYSKFGFKLMEKIEIPEPELTVWGMLRHPQ